MKYIKNINENWKVEEHLEDTLEMLSNGIDDRIKKIKSIVSKTIYDFFDFYKINSLTFYKINENINIFSDHRNVKGINILNHNLSFDTSYWSDNKYDDYEIEETSGIDDLHHHALIEVFDLISSLRIEEMTNYIVDEYDYPQIMELIIENLDNIDFNYKVNGEPFYEIIDHQIVDDIDFQRIMFEKRPEEITKFIKDKWWDFNKELEDEFGHFLKK